ncbi:uncharacterized protein LOC129000815 [Macrosteles quadrilineatus]|uniref:uncharacterized protein LOC129000815 n=1 Tax=Macrosteles quadrilineatus TaxID=74068 RepID=UPI0023E2AA15|nr:uncharacterized protein LOC129000815 [Macrosteles quadrilineatus]
MVDNSDNKEDYLEFSLCGNDTTLIVREVSIDNITRPTEYSETPNDANEEYPKSLEPAHSGYPTATSISFKEVRKSSSDIRASHTRHMNALSTKKWSGNTYFEEEIRRLRNIQYEKEKKQALKMRKLWKSFQKEILKDKRRALLKSSGPEWWQEPSTKQIVLATTLRDVIVADFEEEVTGRTRQWLLDLGVTTRLSPQQVRRCMKLSLLEPVDFLLETHTQLVKAQATVKKKGDLQRPFSVDERLLLSAVCVLQLPTLFTMLHYVLPPPKPYPVDKYFQELLFGDLDDETVRYSSPYMEPLPFRNKVDFDDWAFGKICSALLPIILLDNKVGKKKSEISEQVTSELKSSLLEHQNARVSANSSTIPILLSYCLSKRRLTDSLKVNVDKKSLRGRTFGRRLTMIGKRKSKKKLFDFSLLDKQEQFKTLSETTLTKADEENKTSMVNKDSAKPLPLPKKDGSTYTIQTPPDAAKQVPGQGSDYLIPEPIYSDDYENIYPEYYYGGREGKRTLSRRTVATEASNTSKLTLPSRTGFEGSSLKMSQEPRVSLDTLQGVLKDIQDLHEKEHLKKAIEILSEMGDPVAQLPKIDKLPAIQRWLEIRRGKNRILSQKTKDELLNLSRGMWKSVDLSSSTKGPKVQISKREERKLTWDRKKWLESEVKKETKKYHTTIKQEKVDNARAFFPTMLNHYDYGSKLNRRFRDVYFTYFPAREADSHVHRPWQPQETRNAIK